MDTENASEVEINYVAANNTGSRIARAPNHVPKILIALLVLSQAFLCETYSWDEEEALVVRTGWSVDYGMLTWAVLWAAVIFSGGLGAFEVAYLGSL